MPLHFGAALFRPGFKLAITIQASGMRLIQVSIDQFRRSDCYEETEWYSSLDMGSRRRMEYERHLVV
jgi:hypothetical protein